MLYDSQNENKNNKNLDVEVQAINKHQLKRRNAAISSRNWRINHNTRPCDA